MEYKNKPNDLSYSEYFLLQSIEDIPKDDIIQDEIDRSILYSLERKNYIRILKKEIEVTEKWVKEESSKDIAISIIEHLNIKAKTHYRNVKSNIDFITARMKEGYTKDDLINVINTMVNKWKGSDMEMYLRPETLFGARKFQTYINLALKEKETDEWTEMK